MSLKRPRVRTVLRHTVLAVVIGIAAASGLASPVGAHSGLIEASPAPDETAGGTIDFIELAFNEPVTDAVVTVSYNEETLAGETTVSDGEIIRFELIDALSLPGRYEVSYELTSFDNDRTTSAFFFSYAVGGPQPVGIGLTGDAATEDASGGTDWIPIGIMAMLFVGLACVLAGLVWRLDASRRGDAGI